jgi:hypothetical protein
MPCDPLVHQRQEVIQRLVDANLSNRARMPASSINDPEHWRARAEEMRRLAEDINDAATKEMMLRIARDYETLAVRAEERSRPPKVD